VGVNRARREEAALPHITECGGEVGYQWTAFYPFRTVYLVSFTGREFSDAALREVAPHLESLPSLWYLQIVQTGVTDDGLRQLDSVRNIKQMDLWENDITDEGLLHIRRHSNLVELDLSATLISDGGLEHLQRLKSLRILSLPGGRPPSAPGSPPFDEVAWRQAQEAIGEMRPRGLISEAAVAAFSAAMPSCVVSHTHFTRSDGRPTGR